MIRSTSTAWLNYVVAQQHRWPPQFPPQRTLLTDHGTPALDVPADRTAWTAEHWQAYAEFLEQRGAEITRRLRAAEMARRAAPRRRRPFPDWLSADWEGPAEAGRPFAESAHLAVAIVRLAQGIDRPADMVKHWNSTRPWRDRVPSGELKKVKAAIGRVLKAPHKYASL